jgi:hypothetical protein
VDVVYLGAECELILKHHSALKCFAALYETLSNDKEVLNKTTV